MVVHRDVAETVDAILRGQSMPPELRWRARTGRSSAGRTGSMTAWGRRPAAMAGAPLEPTGTSAPSAATVAGAWPPPACGRCPGGRGAADAPYPASRCSGETPAATGRASEAPEPRSALEQALPVAAATGRPCSGSPGPSRQRRADRNLGP